MTTVTLKIRDEEGNIQKQNHEIESIDLFQFKKAMKILGSVVEELSGNEKVLTLFRETYANFMQDVAPREDYEAMTVPQLKERITMHGLGFDSDAKKERLVDLAIEADKKALETRDVSEILPNISEGFNLLLVELPDKAIELLSVLSYVPQETLEKQKALDAMDIFDAVIEENDIERLVSRAKKSLGATQAKMKFLSFTKKKAST